MIMRSRFVNTVALHVSKVTPARLIRTDVDSQAAAARMPGLDLLSMDIVTTGMKCPAIGSGYGAVVTTGEQQ